MDTIRVGFIGCGRQSGRSIYPSLRAADLELMAVCDADAAKAQSRAAEYGIKNVFTDYRTMCDSVPMDAVLVVVSHQEHYEISLDLLERGYHVWTEKPCAASAGQADEMAEAARKNGRICQTGFNYRYTAGILQAKQMIESGQFATPALFSVHWWLGIPDQLQYQLHYMVHSVDLFLHLMPGQLSRKHIEHHRRDDFDYFVVTARSDDGRISTLELTANMEMRSHWARVDWMSKDGILSVRDFTEVTHFSNGLRSRPPGSEGTPPFADRVWRTKPLYSRPSFVEDWGYVTELERFREAIQGLRPAECTIEEAARGMHLCEEMMAAK